MCVPRNRTRNYTSASYAIARLDAGFPTGPVSGLWTIKLRCESDGPPVGTCLVTVDPNFHTGNQGTVIKQVSGAYRGAVTIDTTRIPNGQHKLVIRSDAPNPAGSTNSGVLGIQFTVSN